jgi:hypothetical protein
MRTERGKNRWLKQVSNTNEAADPVQKFKTAISDLSDVIVDIKNFRSDRKEGFIEIDATKLKKELID